ncbi:restriction endonuclease [Streptomyces sp. SM12]|uniref:restriction endonuclease n=1 Tax=Streptomyces sp. SM12 TaxID=1071602 RepID=UPI000CD506AD|nr:restriction endonuclease [Streptomyces sp. SM12]
MSLGDGDGSAPAPVDTRLRNETLHKVLRRLMLSRGKRRERGGFISYAQLGINQLGAVYEGLMSYSGFIAEEELYEVAKNGDPSGGSWMIPASRVRDFEEGVLVKREDEETGRRDRPVVHPPGSFVYRLAGRDRQTSASYYTPKSLTEVTVELALKYRLDQDGTVTPARELLEWKICEPALGSGAFLNEAIDQVAAEYLRRRERELAPRRIDPEHRQLELQKAKAYVALHNAYGVDLNATAVELAEVSLWLNTMHPGMSAPWFGLHLRRGNSLVGAARKVYGEEVLRAGGWFSKKADPPLDLPFRDGDLPDGAVHHFLLPAGGWGAVAGEKEAKNLAPEEAQALAVWRRGIQKKPKPYTPFEEKDGESPRKRATRRQSWETRSAKSELWRLQRVARRAEFLWQLVGKRLELSERKISRRIDVWGADWLTDTAESADRQQVLADLTGVGTPYWRLKTVMDAWCALWFWPLDKVGDLDGTAPEYRNGGAVVTEDQVAALLSGAGDTVASASATGTAVEPDSGPARGGQQWYTEGLFADPNGEQIAFDTTTPPEPTSTQKSTPKAKSNPKPKATTTSTARLRDVIPLAEFGDWLEFLERVLGTQDTDGSLLTALDELPLDEALAKLGDFEELLPDLSGMDNAFALSQRFPWLHTVEDIAGSTGKDITAEDGHGFFHWELHFAHIFQSEAGGFDLQVGNPPWVRPRWEENAVLAEYDPWFMLTERQTQSTRKSRRNALLESPTVTSAVSAELSTHAAVVSYLTARQTYPLLHTTQPDLYRAFMCRVWGTSGSSGTIGLLHPDSHFTGEKEGELRAAAYRRLRVHGDFVNAGNRFFPPPVGRSSHFGVHVYGPPGEISFDHLSWLFSVNTLRNSLGHDGTGKLPGIKNGQDWDERPHRTRVVRVNTEVLSDWRMLSGAEHNPPQHGRLLSPVTVSESQAIRELASYTRHLADLSPRITPGFHESGARTSGTIEHLEDATTSRRGAASTPWAKVILKGPQIGLANPLFKQPSQGTGELLGLDPNQLTEDQSPESSYRVNTDPDHYYSAQDQWPTPTRAIERESLVHPLGSFHPASEFYRVGWRRQIAPDTERALYVTLLPPGPTHVDQIRTAFVKDWRTTALVSGLWASLPCDYLLRVSSRGDMGTAAARAMPAPDVAHPAASALLLRALRLNCLTRAYEPIWEDLFEEGWRLHDSWSIDWPGIEAIQDVDRDWTRHTPLRVDLSRRAALVEIDALASIMLGISEESLVAMYRARFPVMQGYDATTWFDADGRKIAGSYQTFGFGQTKEHFSQLQDYLREVRASPPDGYRGPFYKADRERELRAAHASFSKRYG